MMCGPHGTRERRPHQARSLQPPSRISSREGSTLLMVLGVCTTVAVLAGTILMAGDWTMRTVAQRASARRVYWLARSEAATVLSSLKAGVSVSAPYQRQYPSGAVRVSVQSGTVLTVKVDATSGAREDIISFTWNPATRAITMWQDNTPTS